MKLSDIFPEKPVLVLKGKEYELEYTFLAERELEIVYGDEEKCTEAIKRMAENPTRKDIVNYLYAGLLHTNLFEKMINKDRHPWRIDRDAAREYLETQLVRNETMLYILAILSAWRNYCITPEMAEVMQIMSAGSQKKTEAETTDISSSTPSPETME